MVVTAADESTEDAASETGEEAEEERASEEAEGEDSPVVITAGDVIAAEDAADLEAEDVGLPEQPTSETVRLMARAAAAVRLTRDTLFNVKTSILKV